MKATSRGDLAAWLDTLTEHHMVIAPRLVEDHVLYQPISSSAEVMFDLQRTALSPKTFFLPDTEVILEIEKRGREVTLAEPSLEQEQILFAVRPCDARGLRTLDALLLDRPPPDTYYAERRAKTALIGLACPHLWDDCFCTSLGGAPDDASDMDLMLYEVESGYLIREITEQGTALLDALVCEETDRSPPESDRSSDEQVPVLPPEAWGALFDDVYWQRLADRCLSCHACTYVCSTCRCFDVRDDTISAGAGYAHIERLRAWDSCMASAYRRIAGGHNPRPSKAQRLRNRYYCKFCYSPLDFGTVACVGCGRCIDVCPVGIDIAEMLGDVARLGNWESGE
ncbi:4Fe-4S dicluster domain-containing protein [Chloroflexota bacterium]